jgi:predicted HNH restriction endonuclease
MRRPLDAARRLELAQYHADYNRKRKAENPEYLEKKRASARRSAKKRRVRIKELLVAARNVPCGECGVKLPPEIMDFDHIFGEKSFVIAHCARQTYRSFQTIADEIRKCRVVCPNCHRMRHYGERVAAREGGYYWTDDQVSEVLPRMVADVANAL